MGVYQYFAYIDISVLSLSKASVPAFIIQYLQTFNKVYYIVIEFNLKFYDRKNPKNVSGLNTLSLRRKPVI